VVEEGSGDGAAEAVDVGIAGRSREDLERSADMERLDGVDGSGVSLSAYMLCTKRKTQGGNFRGTVRSVVAARTEHDGRVRQEKPMAVIPGEIVDQFANKGVLARGHHEADGEAGRVGGGGDKVEPPEGSKAALALQVHVEDDALKRPVSFPDPFVLVLDVLTHLRNGTKPCTSAHQSSESETDTPSTCHIALGTFP
jgi:hypothetical protein